MLPTLGFWNAEPTATFPAWNTGTASNIAFSNGNLTTAGTAAGAGLVRSNDGRVTGKMYWEGTISGTFTGASAGYGVSIPAATTAGLGSTGASGCLIYNNGAVWNGANTGVSFGTLPSAARLGIACDLDNNRIWFRVNGGNWNANAANNPATNTGGIDIAAAVGTASVFKTFRPSSAADAITTNFGASAFVDAMPAGFSALFVEEAPGPDTPTGPVFYVDNAATGTNAGTSWANAWTSFASIAWGSVTPGSTVYISGGTTSKTYTTQLVVGASGSAGNPITITRGVDAGHNGEPIIDTGNSNSGVSATWVSVVCDSRSYVTIKNLAGINGSVACFRLRFNTRDVILENCRAFQPDNASSSPRGYDLRSNVTSGAVGTFAVIVRNCTTATVSSTAGQTDGIWTSANDGVLIEGCSLIISNGDSTGHSDGWQSFQDTRVTFRGNFISHPNGGGDNHGAWLADTATGGTLTVYNNVWMRGTTNQTSAVSHWRSVAAGTGWDGRALFYNNTIYNGWPSFQLENSPLSEARNNIIRFGVGLQGVSLSGTLPPTANLSNNLVWSTSGTRFSHAGYDTNGVNADPLFTNAAGGDFTLQAGSPAINAGTTIAIVTTDRIGTARPQGAAYDMGAYERV